MGVISRSKIGATHREVNRGVARHGAIRQTLLDAAELLGKEVIPALHEVKLSEYYE